MKQVQKKSRATQAKITIASNLGTDADATAPAKNAKSHEAKWTPQVYNLGHTTIPSLLLKGQGRLRLTPNQLNVLLHLVEHWWNAEKNPYPSKETIAVRMGKSSRQVQRYLTELEKADIIKRISRYHGKGRQSSNEYTLNGLVNKLVKLEPEFRNSKEKNRLTRKRVEAKKD
jgi:hypothetical protein